MVRRNTEIRDKFTLKQRATLVHLVTCPDIKKASEAVGVSRKQIYEWFKIPDFRNELASLQNEALDIAVASLKGTAGRAVEVLTALLDDPDSRVRLKCANDILTQIGKFRELAELEERIRTIEEAIRK